VLVCDNEQLISREKGLNMDIIQNLMYKLNVLASARVVCNIMGVQVRGRTHRELYS
jgi:hypothetical protein